MTLYYIFFEESLRSLVFKMFDECDHRIYKRNAYPSDNISDDIKLFDFYC